MTGLKLGTLTTDVKCWQGRHAYETLKAGWEVILRGYSPIHSRHFAVCSHGEYAEQFVYFCDEADVTKALYSKADAVIDLMLQSGVTLADIRKHSKADQL